MSTDFPGDNNPHGNEGGGLPPRGLPQEEPQQPYHQQPPAYGSPYPGGYPQGQNTGVVSAYPDNRLGGWALGLGLAGFFVCGLFTGIPAIVVGVKGVRAEKAGTANNRGMSVAGIILGILAILLSLAGVVAVVLILAGGGWVEFQREFEESLNAAGTLAPLLPLSR